MHTTISKAPDQIQETASHLKAVELIRVAKSMMGFWAISDRVIMMKLEAKPFNINVMQVYAPTQDHDDEEIEQFYQEIQNGIKYTKSDEVICIMGDLNAKVGDERYQNIVGVTM